MTTTYLLSLLHIDISPSLGDTLSIFLTKHAPRLYCYLETPQLVWANVVMDTLIAVSYTAIFLCLMWIALRLRGLSNFRRYVWVFLSFGVFILACGGTHLMDVVNLWWPSIRVAAGIRILCAAVSLPTAVLFAWSTPSLERGLRGFIDSLQSATQQRDTAQVEAKALARQRQEVLDKLAAVNSQLHSVMNSTSELIIEVSSGWTIRYGNEKAVATLPDFSLGADFWRCFPGLQGTEAQQRYLSVMMTRKEDGFRNYYEPYDKWYQTRAYPTQEGISIFSQDITAQVKLEESLSAERRQRERHVEQLSHVTAGVAHEISNPLAIILARASDLEELAESGELPSAEEVQKTCRNIVQTAERVTRILRGLKGLSRQASHDPMELADIRETCMQCVEMQSFRLERYRIAMRLELAEDLPKVWCRETQIGQVVSNLLSNAFDAVVESGVTGSWILLGAEQRGDQLCIRVSDSGPDIPKEIRARVMEPFFTTKPMGQGTGVGLSISMAIASDHGGSLTLLEGTRYTSFELLLPLRAADEPKHSDLEVLAS